MKFAYLVYRYLKDEKNKYEAIISIGLPFSSHLGGYFSLIFNKYITKKFIVEYGDPFYYNSTVKVAYYYKVLEQLVLNKADYIVLPILEAKEKFINYSIDKKLRIIPQGFKLNSYELPEYTPNKIPTFIYAGAFYEEIRNPLKILEELNKLNENYKFIVYTDILALKNMKSYSKIEKEIKLSKGKIILKELIPREKCLIELSKADFLLNISNITKEQTPSKLIDYAIAKRPILSIDPQNFSKEKLRNFIQGNYIAETYVDLNKYKIENIVKEYKKLIEKDKE